MSAAAFKFMLRTVLLVLLAGCFVSWMVAWTAYVKFALRLRVDGLDLKLKRRARTGGWLGRAWARALREDEIALADPETARIGRVYQRGVRATLCFFGTAIGFILALNVIRLIWGLPGVP